MFRGSSEIRLPISMKPDQIVNLLTDGLSSLGAAAVSKNGSIDLEVDKRLRSTFSKVSADGKIRKRNNDYLAVVDFDASLTVWGWVVAIAAFPIGLLVFLSPLSTKGKIEDALKRATRDIEDQTSPSGSASF